MSLGSWFKHQVVYQRAVPAEKGAPEAAGAGDAKVENTTGNVSSLVSGDSLATFAGGSAGITVVWGVIERVSGMPHSLWLGLAISVALGICLLWSDLSDPNRAPVPKLPLRILAGIVNTFILFNAASGALATTGLGGPSAPTPPAQVAVLSR